MDTEKHNKTKIIISLEDLRSLWADLNDKKRLEILKSLIWTSPDNHDFYAKAIKLLKSKKFLETLD